MKKGAEERVRRPDSFTSGTQLQGEFRDGQTRDLSLAAYEQVHVCYMSSAHAETLNCSIPGTVSL